MRVYYKTIPSWGRLFSIVEWNDLEGRLPFTEDEGSGYWVKDELVSEANVFTTSQEDATHVIWFNK